ncbi:MAG: 5-formyltetrahydrofolate cyclo-ligase [Kiritimatiellae bacterium]|nr:5-formyltetrahydrofolate cyclo-ligase [Kiritimatiellia bacterium]
MDERQRIRAEIRAARQELDEVFIETASAAAQKLALALPEWRRAKNTCCYLAAPAEIQTGAIIKKCRAENKTLFVPAFSKPLRQYAPALLEDNDKTRPGRFKIHEPLKPKWIGDAQIDLVFVPGLAFDCRGGRLGHGGGYYDNLLLQPQFRPACKIGLAFDFQIYGRLSLRPGDVRMDMVVTESKIYRCCGRGGQAAGE